MNILYILLILGIIVLAGTFLLYFVKTRLRYESKTSPLLKIADVPAESRGKLAEMKIFFSHHSLGYNIVEGLQEISSQGGAKMNILESFSSSDFDKPIFAHACLGENKQPVSKIEHFVEVMDSDLGKKVDIAILKFCYVDFTYNQDHKQIFDSYRDAVSRLQKRYPRVKFVHFTVPLRSLPGGVNKTIRSYGKWLLRMPTVIDDNLKREQYNALLRDEYGKTGCVFDLALVESIGPDGLSCYVTGRNRKIPFMSPEYSDDGGHLNGPGRRIVAEQLLATLCEIVSQSPTQTTAAGVDSTK